MPEHAVHLRLTRTKKKHPKPSQEEIERRKRIDDMNIERELEKQTKEVWGNE